MSESRITTAERRLKAANQAADDYSQGGMPVPVVAMKELTEARIELREARKAAAPINKDALRAEMERLKQTPDVRAYHIARVEFGLERHFEEVQPVEQTPSSFAVVESQPGNGNAPDLMNPAVITELPPNPRKPETRSFDIVVPPEDVS